jgi:hypothetical protein
MMKPLPLGVVAKDVLRIGTLFTPASLNPKPQLRSSFSLLYESSTKEPTNWKSGLSRFNYDNKKCMFVDCLRECEPIGHVHLDVIVFECGVVDPISRSRLISFKHGVCSLVLI